MPTSNSVRQILGSKTAIVTGGANGIGAEITRHYISLGANVVIADLPSAKDVAEELIKTLSVSGRAIFVAVNITKWNEMMTLFQQAIQKFGQVDIVVANAGIMETRRFFDFTVDRDGNLEEDTGSQRVIDVNLKGTMNTLRLGMFHMKSNPVDDHGFRGSIVLVSSTSGFFGGTAVVSYIASKHGVVGLLRASQTAAKECRVRVNGVAPFITPTFITEGYSNAYRDRGLPLNSPAGVASAIVQTSIDASNQGRCYLVINDKTREVEESRNAAISSYMGADVKEAFDGAKAFFDEVGGYPLPRARE